MNIYEISINGVAYWYEYRSIILSAKNEDDAWKLISEDENVSSCLVKNDYSIELIGKTIPKAERRIICTDFKAG